MINSSIEAMVSEHASERSETARRTPIQKTEKHFNPRMAVCVPQSSLWHLVAEHVRKNSLFQYLIAVCGEALVIVGHDDNGAVPETRGAIRLVAEDDVAAIGEVEHGEAEAREEDVVGIELLA